jgi:hypothetical protein
VEILGDGRTDRQLEHNWFSKGLIYCFWRAEEEEEDEGGQLVF